MRLKKTWKWKNFYNERTEEERGQVKDIIISQIIIEVIEQSGDKVNMEEIRNLGIELTQVQWEKCLTELQQVMEDQGIMIDILRIYGKIRKLWARIQEQKEEVEKEKEIVESVARFWVEI